MTVLDIRLRRAYEPATRDEAPCVLVDCAGAGWAVCHAPTGDGAHR